MQTPYGEPRAAPLWPLGVLLVIFAVADLLMPPAMAAARSGPGAFLVGTVMGVIVAQAGSLTLWAVFGPHPWALR
jgi:hypothetical protein